MNTIQVQAVNNGVKYWDIICNGVRLERCTKKQTAVNKAEEYRKLLESKGDILEAKGLLQGRNK